MTDTVNDVSPEHRHDQPSDRLRVGRLDRALRREIGALVAPFGLTVPKYTALSILRDRPGLSNAQLARRTYVTPQSMNEVLMALEADGLIIRSRSAEHGRVVEAVLQRARARGARGVRPRGQAHGERDARRPRRRRARAAACRRSWACVQRLARLDRRPYISNRVRRRPLRSSDCDHQAPDMVPGRTGLPRREVWWESDVTSASAGARPPTTKRPRGAAARGARPARPLRGRGTGAARRLARRARGHGHGRARQQRRGQDDPAARDLRHAAPAAGIDHLRRSRAGRHRARRHRPRRARPGPRGAPHLRPSDGRGEPARGRPGGARQGDPRGGPRPRRRALPDPARAPRPARRACSPAASSRCWRSAAR